MNCLLKSVSSYWGRCSVYPRVYTTPLVTLKDALVYTPSVTQRVTPGVVYTLAVYRATGPWNQRYI